MYYAPLHPIVAAPDEATPMLTATEQPNFYPPNLLRLLANAPVVLETYLTGARSPLPLAEPEAVQITTAPRHAEGSRESNAIARFTNAVIASRGAVSDDELATFKQAGFDDQAALEIVLGVSLATLSDP
jgi:alkylhydroperoxidase family enzyme